MITRSGLAALVLFVAAGCQTQTSAPPSTPATPSNTQIDTPATRIGGLELNPLETRAAPAAAPANPSPPVTDNPPDLVGPKTERVKAEAGVGVRGKSLEKHSGIIVEPAKAFFRVEQRMVFEVQIPQAMKLFNATEGRSPKSQEEFMSKIIEANQIKLPPLSQGEKYVFDPQKGELMVERPAQ
jgi:hypothetical protein